jgi:hypothetical protein
VEIQNEGKNRLKPLIIRIAREYDFLHFLL